MTLFEVNKKPKPSAFKSRSQEKIIQTREKKCAGVLILISGLKFVATVKTKHAGSVVRCNKEIHTFKNAILCLVHQGVSFWSKVNFI